jgi:hypothetical protein
VSTIQVILQGAARVTIADTFDYPIVLQFGEQTRYENAVWYIPSYAGRIPARRLSEIRVEQGPVSVLVDGPEGFKSGPHPVDWVRSYYPRGKDCALIKLDPSSKRMGGVTISIIEGSLQVDDLEQPGTEPPKPPTDPDPAP